MTDALLPDEAYHEGRRPYAPRPDKDNLPEWEVTDARLYKARVSEVTCPRCNGAAIVRTIDWLEGHGRAARYRTRPCTYCFGTNRIPDGVDESTERLSPSSGPIGGDDG